MNRCLGWELGDLGVSQATPELEKGGQLKHQLFGWPQRQSFVCFSTEALLGARGIYPDKDFVVTDVPPQKAQLFKSCCFLTQAHA